jgi:septal ring factor EnvC (AmiA/AmiB activator)
VTRSSKLLQIFAAFLVAGGLSLSGCAPSESEVAKAKQAGAEAQIQQEAIQKDQAEQAALKAQVKKLTERAAKEKAAKAKSKATRAKSASKVSKAAKTATPCGGNLSVGSNTTCSFAYNVRAEYLSAGGRYAQIDAYSPVTGQYYVMTCTPGVPTVCRGGNNAVVYIR